MLNKIPIILLKRDLLQSHLQKVMYFILKSFLVYFLCFLVFFYVEFKYIFVLLCYLEQLRNSSNYFPFHYLFTFSPNLWNANILNGVSYFYNYFFHRLWLVDYYEKLAIIAFWPMGLSGYDKESLFPLHIISTSGKYKVL